MGDSDWLAARFEADRARLQAGRCPSGRRGGGAHGCRGVVVGAPAVARTFSGRARAARLALVDGVVGAVWAADGRARVAFSFTVAAGRITTIDLRADPEQLSRLEVAFLG